jgi:hypothetical protein
MGTAARYPGLKRMGHETHHSAPCSAEFKNGEAVPPRPHGMV